MRRTGHHLNHTVQDYFSSGIPGHLFEKSAASFPIPLTRTVSEIQNSKKALRREMRNRRRSLSPVQQQSAARRLYRLLVRSSLFRFSKRISFTLARDGEIDPLYLMLEAHKRGKECYLPVMSRHGESRLTFRRWLPGQKLVRRAFNIPEPLPGKACPARALSLVLLPLVAFDASCNRLGMGKGFYDHSFAFLRRSVRPRPVLLGLAHECQRVEKLEVASWDVPLAGIVTDQGWYRP